MARLAECRDVRKLPVRNEDDATLGTREHDLKTIAGTLDKIIRKNKVSKSETVQNGGACRNRKFRLAWAGQSLTHRALGGRGILA
jgi:hypothetical protein